VLNPLAVMLSFPPTDEKPARNVWTVGRELLTAGLTDDTGDGDLVCWPSTEADRQGAPVDWFKFRLTSPSGTARCRGFLRDFRDFLSRTHEVLPVAAEDEAMADLIDECIDAMRPV
jgi:hypothetical protein